jgi:hypothetical protein
MPIPRRFSILIDRITSAASQSQKAADFNQGKLIYLEGEGQPVGVDTIQHNSTLTNTLT